MCLVHPVSDANLLLCEWYQHEPAKYFLFVRLSMNAGRSDLSIRGSNDTISDARYDSKTYRNLPTKKALERQENEKKRNIVSPATCDVDILYLLCYRRTDCTVFEPKYYTRRLQNCLQKNRTTPIQE